MNKNRLIIFEGPDCVGKTTISAAVAKKMGAPLIHLTCTKKLAVGMVDYQLNAIENAHANMELHGNGFVLDRHWPSEMCYGSHFRGIKKDDLLPTINAANKLKPLYVFCMDPIGAENAAARHRRHLDPAHPYNDVDYIAVYQNYEKLIEQMQGYGQDNILVKPFYAQEDFEADLEKWVDLIIEKL